MRDYFLHLFTISPFNTLRDKVTWFITCISKTNDHLMIVSQGINLLKLRTPWRTNTDTKQQSETGGQTDVWTDRCQQVSICFAGDTKTEFCNLSNYSIRINPMHQLRAHVQHISRWMTDQSPKIRFTFQWWRFVPAGMTFTS